ncbi:hypothetical protein BJ742DRAFT_531547 [Cladochytrium replicatum]|nr:hypothetical protein BJ742DRAFT_531547 [Cladochytrium replicatum]
MSRSQDNIREKNLFHNSITAALSFVIASQVAGVGFALTQFKTELQSNFNVKPADVQAVTKVFGCLKAIAEMCAGIAFGITTLNRFQPFADGFGLYKHTTSFLMVVLLVLAAVSTMGSCLAVFAYRSPVVMIVGSLFWAYSIIFDLVVMIAMVWATVANKRVIVQSSRPSEVNNSDSDDQGEPRSSSTLLRGIRTTFRRSNRTLLLLLALIVALDLLALLCFVCEAAFPREYLPISMVSSHTLVAFYLIAAIEFLSQFRNVLRLDARKKRIQLGTTTNSNGGTAQLTTQFNSFATSSTGERGPRETDI